MWVIRIIAAAIIFFGFRAVCALVFRRAMPNYFGRKKDIEYAIEKGMGKGG